MKLRPVQSHLLGTRRLWAAVALSLLGALAFTSFWPAHGQLGRPGKIKNFKWPDFYPSAPGATTNRLKSLVTGTEADPQPSGIDHWEIKNMHLETYQQNGRTNLVASSPKCLLDIALRTVSSTGSLQVLTANRELEIEGHRGFRLEITNFNLTVSNEVRTVIRQTLARSQ